MAEFRGRLRIVGKDVDGNLPLPKALAKITGIGSNLADSISIVASNVMKINKLEKIGNLTDEQVEILEKIITNPLEYGIPEWALNRRKDPFTNETKHLVEVDYKLQKKVDSEHEKEIRSYRGIRYMFNLPVRGQRTKTTHGQKGKTIGVSRKKQQPAKKKKQQSGGTKKKK
ncbi:30S ribosomal protein S13 [Candidatus Micrarchaeota archaeon]|nr:MAG: 30S ribosomal protein S13 [Candidatus Micrarchaeota archaeon]